MSAAMSLPDVPDFSSLVAEMSLEWKLCSPDAFGLTTASPLQRAICRMADGKPLRELANDKTVIKALKGNTTLPGVRPREVTILSGIRTGKSLFAAAEAVHMSQICDLSRIGPGEVPRVSIVSLTKDLADVVFGHVVGRLEQSHVLRRLLHGVPTADSVKVRHPSGRIVEIKVVAGSRAGASLVARWSAGCIFDEFTRMVGESEGVVNWDDSRKGVLLRLLPKAQLIHIGSPWAPFGPAYEMVDKYWGHPCDSSVVVKAPAYDMNPTFWTPEAVEAARTEPGVFRTDVEAEFSTPEEALYSVEMLNRAIVPESDPDPTHAYSAAMDPATRGNSWTFGVFTRTGTRKRMVLARQNTGSRDVPLSPREVFRDMIAPECVKYGIKYIETDQYYVDALQDIAREFGLGLIQTPLSEKDKTERYLAIGVKFNEQEIEIPSNVVQDLQKVRKRITQNGIQIVLPSTKDGRHCDFAPTVMLGIGKYLKDAEPEKAKEDPEAAQMLKEAVRRFGRKKGW